MCSNPFFPLYVNVQQPLLPLVSIQYQIPGRGFLTMNVTCWVEGLGVEACDYYQCMRSLPVHEH
jgi:hypothetical protein